MGPDVYIVGGSYTTAVWGGWPGWTWHDTPANGALTEVVVNADVLANQSVWFSWVFATAENSPEEGYFLDDVRLELQRPCSTPPVASGAPVRFRIDGLPAIAAADVPLSFAVTALDASGQVAAGYSGMGQVSSNDALAVFSATLAFSSGIAQGVVQLRTAGPHAITVFDELGLAWGAGVTNVIAGLPAFMSFAVQPTSVEAGRPMVPLVQVDVTDAFGNVLDDVPVSLAVGDSPGGEIWAAPIVSSTLSDGRARFVVAGFTKAGESYTLLASAGAVEVESAPFDVRPTSAEALAFSRLAP